VEKERALEDVVRGLKNELAEAKATRDRAVGLAAAAEEHEAEVYAGEALRLRKEAHDARHAEAATRRELEDLRRDAAASSTAKDAALNDARAALDAAQGRARAIERAANDEIETLRGALRAAREATEMERASISVGEAKRARERAEEEQVRTTSTVPTIFFHPSVFRFQRLIARVPPFQPTDR
jgi:flotillin